MNRFFGVLVGTGAVLRRLTPYAVGHGGRYPGSAWEGAKMTRTVDLYADDGGTGDGLPVVFLHSLAGNASQWSAQSTT